MAFVSIYPFDATGTSVANRITDELVVVMPPEDISEHSLIIPQAHPFFKSSMIVRTGPNGTGAVLTEGVDYAFFAKFHLATVRLGVPIYSGIRMLNRNYTGSLYLTYQSLGGNFTFDNPALLEELIRQYYSVLTVTFDQIQGVPVLFPVGPHDHNPEDLTGFQDVVTALNGIRDAIISTN